MSEASDLRLCKLQLNSGTGRIPALGFGTLIADPAATIQSFWKLRRELQRLPPRCCSPGPCSVARPC